MMNPDGVRFMAEDKLLKQLSECFGEIEVVSAVRARCVVRDPWPDAQAPFKPNAMLSLDRIENSLTYGFFEMIGVMSRDEEGVG